MQSIISTVNLSLCHQPKTMINKYISKLPHHQSLITKQHFGSLRRPNSCSFIYPNYKYISQNTKVCCSAQTIEVYQSSANEDAHTAGGIVRRYVYEPSPWGTYFLDSSPPPLQKSEKWMEKRQSQLKEKLRKMITTTTDNVEMMQLIDSIQHLGIGYHFESEIEGALNKLQDAKFESDNLYHVSLHFRLLRQNGFFVDADDQFCKFKDRGCFNEKLSEDVEGLLSLYNAGFLANPGEDILDEAISFSKCVLKTKVDSLKSHLKSQVLRALKTPLHRMIPRVETMFYIKEYEEEERRIDIILELAKLDFNILQKMYFEEMQDLALWWKEQNIEENLQYARDRIAECYLFGLALYYEPQYSRARIMVTQFLAIVTVIDDCFDMYCPFEDCKLFNDAIQRWTIEAADHLPTYLKRLYLSFINMVKSFENEILEPTEKFCIPYYIESCKILINAFMEEAEWYENQQIPTFHERKKRSVDDNSKAYYACNALIGVGGVLTEEVFCWLNTGPDILLDILKIGRYIDDIVAYERESTRQCPNTLMCYMFEHNLTKEEAAEKFNALIEDSWKITNKACLPPTPCPREIIIRLMNYCRALDVIYLYYDDGFNKCSHMTELIASLLLKPFFL